ncbi:RecB-like exonuclease [Mycobacterium phage JacoRen57]|nr:RecB-like exonuclease [Mycobacterium phage JacoRen57]
MQPEAKIGKKVREFLESKGAFVFKVHGGPQMMAGLPDLIVCHKGMFWGVEMKQPGQKPTPRQLFVHSLIRRAGGGVIVATCVDDVLEIVA